MCPDKLTCEIYGNTIELTGKDHPDTFIDDWDAFLLKLERLISSNKELIIDFKMDYYGSSSSRFVSSMFNSMNENYRKCKPIVNWHYYEADEAVEENGIIWSEIFTKVKFNFIIRNK